MNNKIIISSDSTCDLSKELIERYNINIIPLGVTLGTKVFRDGVDITPDDIYEHHRKTGELPKTTAANVGEYEDFFSGLIKDGESLIHFTVGSKLSSTYNNASIAASSFENIYIVDSENLSTGSALLVIAAAEMVKSGMEAEAIAENCRKLAKNVSASFVIDNLDYLYKGGRCSGLAVLGANLLKLKPCIMVKNGSMDVDKKYRGKFMDVLINYTDDMLSDRDNIADDRVFVTNAGCDKEIVDAVVERVKSLGIFKEVFVTRAGCTISSHCGQNTLGVLFVKKKPIA